MAQERVNVPEPRLNQFIIFRKKIPPCKYEVTLAYSANLVFYLVYNIGGVGFEYQDVRHIETMPTFIFQ
jgi:hypothetical protein